MPEILIIRELKELRTGYFFAEINEWEKRLESLIQYFFIETYGKRSHINEYRWIK